MIEFVISLYVVLVDSISLCFIVNKIFLIKFNECVNFSISIKFVRWNFYKSNFERRSSIWVWAKKTSVINSWIRWVFPNPAFRRARKVGRKRHFSLNSRLEYLNLNGKKKYYSVPWRYIRLLWHVLIDIFMNAYANKTRLLFFRSLQHRSTPIVFTVLFR